MELDRLDIAFALVAIGIILLLISISVSGKLGIDVSMRPGTWAGVGITAIGIAGLAIGTCVN